MAVTISRNMWVITIYMLTNRCVSIEIYVDSQKNLVSSHRKFVLLLLYRKLIQVSDIPKRLELFMTLHSVTSQKKYIFRTVAYPGILFGVGSTNSVEDRGQRERGSGGGIPLVRGSEGSCNLVQEISFHIVKFS